MTLIRTRKKTTKDIDKRVHALRTDVSALQGDVKGLVEDTTDVAANVATERARSAMRAAEAVALRALRLAEDTAFSVKGDVEDWTQDNLDSARDQIRSQPFSAIFVSLGIGALIGAIFLRS
jgi:ElaB/YqjD/DUF883 family membrane-anchored ribosome-binding protein